MAKHGATALYKLALPDLQYWHHVEKLSPTELQTRYLHERGVYAHRANLVMFLNAPAQSLPVLSTNEDVHSHACGEYVLEELQKGVSAEVVAHEALRLYLVKVARERLAAYRRHREQTSEY